MGVIGYGAADAQKLQDEDDHIARLVRIPTCGSALTIVSLGAQKAPLALRELALLLRERSSEPPVKSRSFPNVTTRELRQEANAAEFIARLLSNGREKALFQARAAQLRFHAQFLEQHGWHFDGGDRVP